MLGCLPEFLFSSVKFSREQTLLLEQFRSTVTRIAFFTSFTTHCIGKQYLTRQSKIVSWAVITRALLRVSIINAMQWF